MKRVVCIGGGLAAIYFSLLLSEEVELYLILGEGPEESNSYLAKGGIAVSLDIEDQAAHIADTLVAGAGLCNPQIVKEIAQKLSVTHLVITDFKNLKDKDLELILKNNNIKSFKNSTKQILDNAKILIDYFNKEQEISKKEASQQ